MKGYGDIVKEVWKGLVYGGKDYSEWIDVSNLGRVRNPKTGTIRRQNLLKTGYYFVSFSMGSRDKNKTFRVHKGLAEVFIPNPKNKSQVNHIDGNKLNNDLKNLEWATNQENIRHAHKIGLVDPSAWDRHSSAKLTDEQVLFIRKNYKSHNREFGTRGLARRFNIDHTTVQSVLRNKTYKDVV